MDTQIQTAIGEHRLLAFEYDGFPRIVEPHVFGLMKGHHRLLAYQVKGASRSGKLPDWRYFDLPKMAHLRILDEMFPGPREFGRPPARYDVVVAQTRPLHTAPIPRPTPNAVVQLTERRPQRRHRNFFEPDPAVIAAQMTPLPGVPDNLKDGRMLDKEISNVARNATLPHLRERKQALGAEIRDVLSDHVRRGMLRSGMFQGAVFRVCAAEVSYRASFIWERLRQTLNAARIGLYDGLLRDIEQEIESYRDQVLGEIGEAFETEVRRSDTGIGNARSFDEKWNEAVKQVMGDAGMEVLRMRNSEKPMPSTTVHFHQAGIFQQGDHNVANQTQNISGTDLAELRRLLDELLARLPTAGLDEESLDAAESVVADAKVELTKRKPSLAATAQLVSSLAMIAEKAPALKQVYVAVAKFMEVRGVPLPVPAE